MRFGKEALQAALAAAVTLGAAGMAHAQTQNPVPAPVPAFKHEKCFGITKAGKNDCQTANSSCAGTAKRHAQADAWLYVPAGTCDKIQGASLTPKKA